MPAKIPTHNGARYMRYTSCMVIPPISIAKAPIKSIDATTHIGLRFAPPICIFRDLLPILVMNLDFLLFLNIIISKI